MKFISNNPFLIRHILDVLDELPKNLSSPRYTARYRDISVSWSTNLVLTLLTKTLIVSEGQIFNRPYRKAMVFLKLTVKHYALKIWIQLYHDLDVIAGSRCELAMVISTVISIIWSSHYWTRHPLYQEDILHTVCSIRLSIPITVSKFQIFETPFFEILFRFLFR